MIKPVVSPRAAALGTILATIAATPAVAKPLGLPSAPAAAGSAEPTTSVSSAPAAACGAGLTAQHKAAGRRGKGQSFADTSSCGQARFSQPFLSSGDSHSYTLAPGQSVDDFSGTGWTFSAGAAVVN